MRIVSPCGCHAVHLLKVKRWKRKPEAQVEIKAARKAARKVRSDPSNYWLLCRAPRCSLHVSVVLRRRSLLFAALVVIHFGQANPNHGKSKRAIKNKQEKDQHCPKPNAEDLFTAAMKDLGRFVLLSTTTSLLKEGNGHSFVVACMPAAHLQLDGQHRRHRPPIGTERRSWCHAAAARSLQACTVLH